MSISGTAVAPGWYPDPAGSTSVRWWDGGRWTEHLQPRPALPPLPAVVLPAAPAWTVPADSTGRWGSAEGFGGQQWAASTAHPGLTYDPAAAYRTSNQPGVTVSNTMAWIGFSAGIIALAAVFLKLADPSVGAYLPVFGVTAIITSIRALVRHHRGAATVLWAPVVGLILGSVAEVMLVIVIVTGSMTYTTTSSGLSGSHAALGSDEGDSINYSMGRGGVQYPPSENPNLSSAAVQEAALVAKLRAIYGRAGFPSDLHLNSTGLVVATDGQVIGDFLERGWFIAYTRESDGSYLLEISALPTSEVAVYFSATDEYWAWCSRADATCRTSSPVPPSTSQTPAIPNDSVDGTTDTTT